VDLPRWDGWHLAGVFDSDVGSWLLHHGGEALLLEVPEGLTVGYVQAALAGTGATLRFVTASHCHEDHLDRGVWEELRRAFPGAEFIDPAFLSGHDDYQRRLGGESVWLVRAPKHSGADLVTVFRGVAMTGDVELGTLASVNDEVPARVRKRSMHWLSCFPARHGYRVHSVVSAHLDDVRTGINWPALFECRP
jgi:hypothetical protein